MKKERNVYTKKQREGKPRHGFSIHCALILSLLAIIALFQFSCDNDWVIAILPDRDKGLNYGITLSISGLNVGGSTHELTPEAIGYTAIADTVTIANIGKEATGILSIEMSGADSGSFTLSTDSVGSIERSGDDTFTIAPVTGLGAGNYSAELSVWGGNGIRAGFTLSFTVGDGSALDPYIVHDEESLRLVGSDGTDTFPGARNLSAHYKQTKDIDLTGKANWVPIGLNIDNFQGSYEGNGYIIKGIRTNDELGTNRGFFSTIDSAGEVRNLRLIDVEIIGSTITGGIAGENKGIIENCEVSGTVTNNMPVTDYGGLAGKNNGTIKRCYTSVNVNGRKNIGGIAGINYGTIERCYATGNVTGESDAGGIAGYNAVGGTIEDCYALGDVTGMDYVGGVSGSNIDTIKHCYALGEVTGTYDVGGVIGFLSLYDNLLQNCVALNPQIIRSSSTDPNFGKVVGTISSTITNCFALAGMTLPEDATGYNGTDFYNTGQAAWSAVDPTGPGFDFDTVWEWSSAKNRPILRGVGGQ